MSLSGSFGQESHTSPIPSPSISDWSSFGISIQLSVESGWESSSEFGSLRSTLHSSKPLLIASIASLIAAWLVIPMSLPANASFANSNKSSTVATPIPPSWFITLIGIVKVSVLKYDSPVPHPFAAEV